MKTVHRTAPRQTKNESGQRLCRMPDCGKPVGKGLRSYCSAACREAFSIAYFPSFARRAVYKRDKGVCVICGCDTDKLRRMFRWVARFIGRKDARSVAKELGFNGYTSSGGFWQADHIHECVRGGWGTGLDNLRTLCTPCHLSETNRLAAELAAERRAARQDAGALFVGGAA